MILINLKLKSQICDLLHFKSLCEEKIKEQKIEVQTFSVDLIPTNYTPWAFSSSHEHENPKLPMKWTRDLPCCW